jgi:hypothetical protein
MFGVDYFKERVAALQAKINEFESVYQRLTQLAPLAPNDPSVQETVAKGNSLRNTIASVMAKVRDTARWIKEQTGLDVFGLDKTSQQVMGELGVAFLVPLAIVTAIAGGIWAINDWLVTAKEQAARLEALRSVPVEQRAATAAKLFAPTQGAFTSGISGGITVAILVAAAIFILPQIMRGMRK